MQCEELEMQMAEYLEGSAGPEARRQVEQHLAECAACQGAAAMWDKLAGLPLETAVPRAGFPAEFRKRLSARVTGGHYRQWWAAAAALLIGVLGFTAGRYGAVPPDPAADMAGLRKEVRNLREVVALSLLEQQSASDRLRGIRYSTALDKPDPEVIDALARTLETDSSVDVRLAAADALRRYPMTENMRSSVWELLERDESPLVQVAVIDLLVARKEPGLRSRLETLRGKAGLDPSVREYLQAVLSNQRDRKKQWQ